MDSILPITVKGEAGVVVPMPSREVELSQKNAEVLVTIVELAE